MNRPNNGPSAPWSMLELFFDQWMSFFFQRTFQPPAPWAQRMPQGLPELAPRAAPPFALPPPSQTPPSQGTAVRTTTPASAEANAAAGEAPQKGTPSPTDEDAPPTQALDVDQLMALASGGGLSALTDLDDDFVKLIGFSIVSVRRGHEKLVTAGSTVVAGPMSQESFVSWMIAKHGDSIDKEQEKYLRVHYTIARRWPREPLDFEENQLKTLDGIRRVLAGEPSYGLEKTSE